MVYENSVWAELKRNYIEGSMSMRASCALLKSQGKKVPNHATVEQKAMKEDWRKLRLEFIQEANKQMQEDLLREKIEDFRRRQKAKQKWEKAIASDPKFVPSTTEYAVLSKMDAVERGETTDNVGQKVEIYFKDYGNDKAGDNPA